MINLDRMKQYIELGFTKEEALDLVKDEEAKEEAKSKEHDELLDRIKKLEEKPEEKAEEKPEDIKIPAEEDKTMTLEDAFTNIFVK